MMKHSPHRPERAPSSAESFGSLSDDGSRDLLSESTDYERKDRRRRRRARRKGDTSFEKGVKKSLTPAVKILLFGLLMSFLDVLWIFEHLENSAELQMTQSSSAFTETQLVDISSETSKHKLKISGSEQKPEISGERKDPTIGREPIIKILRDAGIQFDAVKDADLLEELPLWSDVVNLYGAEPVIYGLEQGNCQRFQEHSEKSEHFLGTAGTFNTGTNLMSELLIANCMMPDRMKKYGNKSRGIRWQVPWGKHSPVGDKEYRESHKTAKDKAVDANEIMPMVTIRDPLIWLKSMCRHKYTAKWPGFAEIDHCPNFSRPLLEVTVKYDGFRRSYESLMHLWNEYYNEYMSVEKDLPFLLVRFEDLIFHTEEVTTKVCECAGGKRVGKKFKYIVDSAKKGMAAHGAMSLRTGFVDALAKYSTLEKRYKGFDDAHDLEYVRDHIDQKLLEMMKYKSIDPLWKENQQQPATI